ncbi:XRE family transcriptional regulator [Bailinhaonella thermotolerans]|uniref:XRE family transcriptional regulator n=1 Tax=Bailinhaonella thermotolerans TaxID=1070861 RepID=A0A3A4A951_9ACTN|nr:XRE family transcriptional regulator [Bailinhaonella thermotolerans]
MHRFHRITSSWPSSLVPPPTIQEGDYDSWRLAHEVQCGDVCVTASEAAGLSEFSEALRTYRQAAGLSQERLAERTSFSRSLIAMVERGDRRPTPEFAVACDEILKTRGALAAMLRLERLPPWFAEWTDVEREATSFKIFTMGLVPGLLQIPAYARTALSGGRAVDVEEAVAMRMDRQKIFERGVRCWVVVEESVLLRPSGSARVMQEQLAHLIDMAGRLDGFQVLPLAHSVLTGTLGSFTIASLPGAEEGCAYVEGAPRGQVTSDSSKISALSHKFEAVRTHALSHRESLDLIKTVEERWARSCGASPVTADRRATASRSRRRAGMCSSGTARPRTAE